MLNIELLDRLFRPLFDSIFLLNSTLIFKERLLFNTSPWKWLVTLILNYSNIFLFYQLSYQTKYLVGQRLPNIFEVTKIFR